MPDITMCLNAACPRREQCYRFMATPESDLQSMTVFQPDSTHPDRFHCRFHMPMEQDEQLIVTGMSGTGPAAMAGIEPGDRIRAVGSEQVSDLVEMLRPGAQHTGQLLQLPAHAGPPDAVR